ncbi:hypothetical protein M378DRAFT_163462 [Amanita muscaria Koide BX008]|uniref:DUF6532 domain-containing protein n=1 Tax=Amanita muscaria (strain Koide BX008) TaxID=946122 RepID=A0A0C2SM00_AMAMK|nr:hypothetical protein M378DRAFT_163462 [Amanita muscaria Koide BX008]
MGKRKVTLNVPPPANPSSNPGDTDPPELSRRYGTRHSNKDAHPGLPDKPQARRSTQEVTQERQEKELTAIRKGEEQMRAIQKVADLEDRYRQEDISRVRVTEVTQSSFGVNEVPHPRQAKSRRAPIILEGAESDSSGEDWDPPEHPTAGGEVSEEEEDSEEEVNTRRQNKQCKKGRDDINALRVTVAATGTPTIHQEADVTLTKASKRKGSKFAPETAKKTRISVIPSGLRKDWDPNDQPKSRLNNNSLSGTSAKQDDDSMVTYGGMASEDEDDRDERRALFQYSQKSHIDDKALVKITQRRSAPQPGSKREARDGRDKWKLDDLPDSKVTKDVFRLHIVPAVFKDIGELAPWVFLSIPELQAIVDKTFGDPGKYVVEDDGVWYDLLRQKVSEYRHTFVTKAKQAIKELFDSYPDDFPDPSTIAAWVKRNLAIIPGTKTMPFMWKEITWRTDESDEGAEVVGRKKGPFQSDIILSTFSAHYVMIRNRPDKDAPRPIAALIYAIQAVEHVLKCWTTGQFVNNTSTSNRFSVENYGDAIVTTVKAGKSVKSRDNRATKFVPSLMQWKEETWDTVFSTVNEYLDDSAEFKRSKSAAASYPSSEVDVISEPDSFIVVSDEE